MLFLFFLVFFIFSPAHAQQNRIDTNISQIIIVTINGPRAPIKSYPTDPYGSSYWARYGGLGQTTSRGLFESYLLGQLIKGFYGSFLTSVYSPQRVSVKSVDSDASLSSVLSFISGMYPPANADQLWSPNVNWFPIPIHPINTENYQVFRSNCPKYVQLINNSLNTNTSYDIEVKNMMLIRNISSYTGLGILKYLDLGDLYDNAYSKLSSGLPLELWLNENLQSLNIANDYNLNLRYGTIEKARYVSGGLLFDIIQNMKRKMSGSSKELIVYSVLNYQLNALMTLLKLAPFPTNLQFGSTLIIELRKDQRGLYYTNLLFRNESQAQSLVFRPIKMNECDLLCNVGNFFDITLDRIITNFTEDCFDNENNQITTPSPTPITVTVPCPTFTTPMENYKYQKDGGLTRTELALIIVTSILGGFLLITLISIGLYCYRNRTLKESF